MKKVAIILIAVMVSMLFLPNVSANTIHKDPSPEFEVYLGTSLGLSFNYGGIEIYVRNIGDAPAHNVTSMNLEMDGMVIYNDRGIEWGPSYDESLLLEPGDQIGGYPKTAIFGFGRFTVNMTITCDEGIIGMGTGNGIILGFLVFVP